MFSARLPRALHANAIAAAAARLRAADTPFIDLTLSNPTRAGIAYPPELLRDLASDGALTYTPQPLGALEARIAAARDEARRGRAVSPDRIVLTASTSEAYSLLFKLLCDAGDEVLVPQPSYPLFDLLARLDGVHAANYRLVEHNGWSLDRDGLLRAMTPRTRAVLAVSPNNPTGSVLDAEDARWLDHACASRGIAVILDEVFADFVFEAGVPGARALARDENASPSAALTFRLNGLSKSAGLPQVKLGWMAVDGPAALIDDALRRLEVICDMYLSVSTPVQVAAASLIEGGAAVRSAIQARLDHNLRHLRAAVLGRSDVTLLEPQGGWSAVVRVPAVRSEEDIVRDLIERAGVLVHPGYFFDFDREAYLVVSLLPAPDAFAAGVTRMLDA